jgi:hypothetical protein
MPRGLRMCFGSYLADYFGVISSAAVIAQLGERKTEDLKVSGSIPDCGKVFYPETNFSIFTNFEKNEKKMKTVILLLIIFSRFQYYFFTVSVPWSEPLVTVSIHNI